MKLHAKSQRRIKMAARTWIVKINALILLQFGLLAALNFQLFRMVTAYNTRYWNWSETCLWLHISQLERRICKEREDIFKLAKFMAFLTGSYCLPLSALKSMFSHSIWAFIGETMNKTLTLFYYSTLIPLESLVLPSGSQIVSCFSAQAEIPFWLHKIFSARAKIPFRLHEIFSARDAIQQKS